VTIASKLVRVSLNPQLAVHKACRALGVGSFEFKLEYDLLPRPAYGFCVYYAAQLAHRLGIPRINVAEFGVAGGNGLVELERMAEQVERIFPVEIDVYGFDLGEGLPAAEGYRDLPYIWKPGFYRMDHEALRSKLTRAELVLGNVRDTVPAFIEKYDPAPFGAVFMDLDYWSSTRDALRVFGAQPERLLPRVQCYFDDVLSAPGGGLLNEFVGQLAAINGYNESNESSKLAPIAGLRHARKIPSAWNDKIYVHHMFEHPRYNEYVHEEKDRQLRLEKAAA